MKANNILRCEEAVLQTEQDLVFIFFSVTREPTEPCFTFKFYKTECETCMNSNKYYPCIVDYHSKFPVVKEVEGLSTDILMKTCKIIFLE